MEADDIMVWREERYASNRRSRSCLIGSCSLSFRCSPVYIFLINCHCSSARTHHVFDTSHASERQTRTRYRSRKIQPSTSTPHTACLYRACAVGLGDDRIIQIKFR